MILFQKDLYTETYSKTYLPISSFNVVPRVSSTGVSEDHQFYRYIYIYIFKIECVFFYISIQVEFLEVFDGLDLFVTLGVYFVMHK